MWYFTLTTTADTPKTECVFKQTETDQKYL